MRETINSAPEIKDKDEERKLLELKSKHPGNNLFKKDFSDQVPSNFVSVYHYTQEARIDRIGEEGLKPIFGAISKDEWVKNIKEGKTNSYSLRQMFNLERTFNRTGREMGYGNFDRLKTAVYAFPCKKLAIKKKYETSPLNNIELEIKTDPKNIILADSDVWTAAMEMIEYDIQENDLNEEEVEAAKLKYAKKYWDSAISYEDYLKLSPDDKEGKNYEVLMLGGKEGVSPDFIKLSRVIA